MGPPKKASAAAAAAEDDPSLADLWRLIKSQSEQLASQSEQLTNINSEMRSIKVLVESLKDENKNLRAALKLKDEQLMDMQTSVNSLEIRLNNLEQHHRGWGARVLNIPTTEAEEADPEAMISKVYTLALRPLLEGAVKTGRLKELPSAEQVLEVAHVLPGKPGLPKPIIMRFYNRNVRNLCFQLKKEFAEREPPRGPGGQQQQQQGGGSRSRRGGEQVEGDSGQGGVGRYRYPLYDDLTKANLAKMRAISQDDRVLACWSVNGQLRFKLKESNVIKKVQSILDPLDVILR